jgi:ABC-2 type transport system permease protein
VKTGVLVVVVLAGALLVVVRRTRSRGSRAQSPLVAGLTWFRRRAPWAGAHKPLGDTGLVAGREIRERMRGRVFRVVTAILFVAVAAAIVIPPALHSANPGSAEVGVVRASPALEDQVLSVAKSVKFSVRLVDEPDLATAKAALSAARVKLVVDGTTSLVVDNPVSASDTSAGAQFVRALAGTLGAEKAFVSAGLSQAQASIVARAKALPVMSLKPAKRSRTTAESTALIGVVMIFVVLTQYLTWTLMGVMEEKASRVVEVLLATVRPVQLLAGKLLGIGVVAMVQAGALVAFALLLADVVGSSVLRGAAPLVVAASLAWLVLGYAFYSWLYAAAGSLAERQDQVQSMALPLSAPMLLGYIVALTGASSGSPSLLVKVLAYLPPTAPFAMPTLVGFGQVAWWQFAVSVALSLLATVGVALGAARVYRRAVLRTGRRVRLRDVVTSGAGS